MVSELQSHIVADISVNDVTSVPPSKKIKSAIVINEAMKFSKIYDAETLASGAASAAKCMKLIIYRYLKSTGGKLGNYVRELFPNRNPHWFGSLSGEGSTAVKSNRYMSPNISMIWVTTAMGDKNDRQIS